MVLLNGPIIVDTFFNISGFLACYLLLLQFQIREKRINFLMLYVHRILRLTPAYAVIVAFYCTLLIKLGNGPLWEERIGIEQERCLSSWWTNLLYINNYVNVDKIVSCIISIKVRNLDLFATYYCFSACSNHGTSHATCISFWLLHCWYGCCTESLI